jgi:hypothetical protein
MGADVGSYDGDSTVFLSASHTTGVTFSVLTCLIQEKQVKHIEMHISMQCILVYTTSD